MCIRDADECVDSYLSCGTTSGTTSVTVDLNVLKPHFENMFSTMSIAENNYLRMQTWKNKGGDFLNEALAEFDLQTISIAKASGSKRTFNGHLCIELRQLPVAFS